MTVTRTLDRQVPRPCGRRQLVTSVRMGNDTAVLQAQAALPPNFRGPLCSLCLSFLSCQMDLAIALPSPRSHMQLGLGPCIPAV